MCLVPSVVSQSCAFMPQNVGHSSNSRKSGLLRSFYSMKRDTDKVDRLGHRRDTGQYDKRYSRIQLQPFWAWFGLVACSVLILINGWYYIFAAANNSARFIIIGLIESYFGVSHYIHAEWTELEHVTDFVCSLYFSLHCLGCIIGDIRVNET